MDMDLMNVILLLSAIVGLAAGLVKLAREIFEWANSRVKKKGRHFKSDDLTA